MKCLVFGAAGQVARSLSQLDSNASQIKCLGRPDGDVTSRRRIEAALAKFTPDVVINAAAYTAVDNAEDHPERAHAVNADGAAHLAAACHGASVPLIHFSTDYVFDGSGTRPWQPDDDTAPLGVYGQSKLEGEAQIRAIHPQHIILRTAWVFSPYGQNFVKTIIRLAHEKAEINIVQDQIGSPTYAPDLAAATLKIAAQILDGQPAYGTYHLTNGGETSWDMFARAIIAEIGGHTALNCSVKSIDSHEYPTRAQRPKNARLDVSKVTENFGIVMPMWRNALSRCIEALKMSDDVKG